MSGVEQLQYLSWLLYLVVFVVVLVRTIRRPTAAHVDMSLFFGAIALVVALTGLRQSLHVALPLWLTDLAIAAVLALGYLLLRLVRDFSDVPMLVMRAVEIGMVLSIIGVIAAPSPLPGAITLGVVAYLVLVFAYDAWGFVRQVSRTQGVTRRRMQAA